MVEAKAALVVRVDPADLLPVDLMDRVDLDKVTADLEDHLLPKKSKADAAKLALAAKVVLAAKVGQE